MHRPINGEGSCSSAQVLARCPVQRQQNSCGVFRPRDVKAREFRDLPQPVEHRVAVAVQRLGGVLDGAAIQVGGDGLVERRVAKAQLGDGLRELRDAAGWEVRDGIAGDGPEGIGCFG